VALDWLPIYPARVPHRRPPLPSATEIRPLRPFRTFYEAAILADAPTAYWRLEELAGATVAVDRTGNGHDATLPASGITYHTPGALQDASYGYALAGTQLQAAFSNIAVGTTCTIELWIRPDSTTAPSPYAIVVGNGGGGVGLYYDKSTQKMLLYIGANERNGSALTDGSLYYIAISISAGAGTWYVNGVPDGTFTGWPGQNFDTLFNGLSGSATIKCSLLDEVALYPTALSPGRIARHYQLRLSVLVPDILADDFFLPIVPGQIPHHHSQAARTEQTYPPVVPDVLTPTRWLPSYPSRVPHRRTRAADHPALFAPPPGHDLATAQRLAWQARYPAAVPHRRPPLRVGGSPPFVLASSILSSLLTDCVDLADVALGQSTLLDAVVPLLTIAVAPDAPPPKTTVASVALGGVIFFPQPTGINWGLTFDATALQFLGPGTTGAPAGGGWNFLALKLGTTVWTATPGGGGPITTYSATITVVDHPTTPHPASSTDLIHETLTIPSLIAERIC